jgi:glycosyltransferase involved in cell wall biosynthesis
MHVLTVVSIAAAREGAGNAERAVQLARALEQWGMQSTLLTLDIGNWQSREELRGNANLEVLPCLNERFHLPVPLWGRISKLVSRSDIIHCVGYWSPLAILVSLAAKIHGIPYIVSPAGALPLFGRSKCRKALFNWMVGKRFVRKAAGWIAVTKSELPDFMNYGVPAEHIAIIPNGVVEAEYAFCDESFSLLEKRLPSYPFILFMGRLNPIKGPDLLLEAFVRFHHDYPNVSLVFAGPDEGMKISLEQRAAACGLTEKIRFIGFVGGAEKTAVYHAATVLVVPSRMEAMSIVAVEAGICGKPVLMTDQCGLNDPAEINPGLVVQASVEGLADGLRLAFTDLDRLTAWGNKWQSLVRERFLWRNQALKLKEYIEQIVANGKH